MSIVRVSLLLVVLVTGPAAALAQEAGAAAETQTVEPVVVTATKVEALQERIGATVTVITGEEIRAYNYQQLREVLRIVPGVEIQRSGNSVSGLSQIRIRGANPNQVQVLVDGLRVKSPTSGSLDLSELSLDAIDRIEVVRGPQSTLYGADAIGGVVNVITKKGAGPAHGSVSFEGGNYDTFRETAGVQGAYRGFNFNLSGSRLDTDGQFPNDDAERTSFGGRIGYDFPWKGELSVTGRYARVDVGLPINTAPGLLFLPDPNQRQETETYLLGLVYSQRLVDRVGLTARFGQWGSNLDFKDSPPPGALVIDSRIENRRIEGELIAAADVAPWDTLTIGAERRSELGRETERGSFPSSLREEINTTSVWGQDEVRILDRLFLAGGVRWDDNDVFGDELTGRASAALVIRETGSKLRGAWGTGFRAPTIDDLFFPGFSNPALKPETSESWEVGFDQKAWRNRVRVGVTYFHNRFRDLIQFDGLLFIPVNVGRARTEGVEAYLEIDPVDWVTVYANYTFTDTEDLDSGLELRRFPRHRWNTGVTLTPVDPLTLFMQARVVSSHLEDVATRTRNPGYHTIDAGGTWRLLDRAGHLERLELTARVQNLADERYDEVLGFRALGINALVGLRAYYR
jgi:vitamin B12 transporter